MCDVNELSSVDVVTVCDVCGCSVLNGWCMYCNHSDEGIHFIAHTCHIDGTYYNSSCGEPGCDVYGTLYDYECDDCTGWEW